VKVRVQRSYPRNQLGDRKRRKGKKEKGVEE
jgi:hypothetical protein